MRWCLRVAAVALVAIVGTLSASGAVSATPDASPPGMLYEEGVRVRMRDGVELVADVFRPNAPGPHPVILELTPYGRQNPGNTYRDEAPYWTSHGFAFVLADVRGQGDSGGRFEWFVHDAEDGYDLVEWLARQTWSSGRVGLRGSSYTGTNQWYIARARPPHLACLTPSATVHDPFLDLPYPQGVFMYAWGLTWISSLSDSGVTQGRPIDWEALQRHRPLLSADVRAFGRELPLYREMLAHPTLDAFWSRRRFSSEDYATIDLPTLSFSGWFDGTLPGTIARYRAISAHSPRRNAHWLIIGPWEHLSAPDGGYDFRTGAPITRVGKLTLPETGFLRGQELTRQFFESCLKDGPAFSGSPVRLFLTGSNRWVEATEYPPAGVRPRKLYLAAAAPANTRGGGGRLQWTPAASGRASDTYIYDPRHPVPSTRPDGGGGPLGVVSWPGDLGPRLDRDDMLVYVSDRQPRPLSLAGPVSLVLHAASDATDTDFFANLEDVAPDGHAIKLGSGNGAMIRARYRDGYERERLLTRGKPVALTLEFFDIGHTLLPGHRLRLSITSSSTPWTAPNPNTGGPIATDVEPPRRARQTIFHDAVRPSHLLLPVLPEP